MKLTPEERDQLIGSYAWKVVDDMDIKDLCQFAADVITTNLETETDESLVEHIKEYYPDLLEK